MQRKILLTLSIVACYCATAQKQRLDSLQRILQLNRKDTNYVKAAALISEIYRNSNSDSSIKYAESAIAAAKTKESTRYVAQAYNSIGYANYFKGQYPKAIAAFKEYFNESAKINDRTNMAFAVNNEGNVYIELGDYNTALDRYHESLKIRQENNDTYGIAASYNNIGYIYKDIGDYEKALNNFLFALKEFEKIKAEQAIASTYNYIAAVYWRKKDYAAAIDAGEKAFAIQQKFKDKNGMGISLQGIANVYGEQKKYDKAIEYYQKALELYQVMSDFRQIALVQANLGEVAYRKGDYQEALTSYKKSIELSQKIGNKRSLATAWLGAASAEINLNDLTAAKVYLDSSELLINKTNKKEDRKNLFLVQSNYYSASNNYKTALEYYNRYADQKDSILNQENLKSIADMQVKYETEKKQLQIELLNKDNSIKSLAIQNQQLELNKRLYKLSQQQLQLSNAHLTIAANDLEISNQNKKILEQKLDSTEKEQSIQSLNKQGKINELELKNQKLLVNRKNITITVISIVTALLLLLGISFYRRYKLKKEKQLQAEVFKQQELATKAVLEAEENERQRIAGDLHDGVGQLMSAAKMNLSAMEAEIPFANDEQRRVYEKVLTLVDESCKEVRSVSHNMMPNALLKAGLASAVREFLNQIDGRVIKVDLYTEGLNERIDSNIETVLYRVIQESVNNVIKHSGANHLDISLIKDADGIAATIEDNGKGFDTSDKNKFDGIGLKNIQTRIEYLKGTVEWNSSPGKGTLVAIHVPMS